MKQFLSVIAAAILLSSCSLIGAIKNMDEIMDGVDDEFADYAGMNINTEPLQGKAFVAPEGINITISAANNDVDQTEDEVKDDYYGSGCFVVNKLVITNETDSKKEIILPAGLMVQSASSDYQNGILVKNVKVNVDANSSVEIYINMYCLNAAAHASDPDASYNVACICDIAAFTPLFNVCNDKKVNIEQYRNLGIIKYYSATLTIQEIVWAITKGKTFTEKEIKGYLKKIAND